MSANDEVSSQDIASTLSSLGETTTAAELVRKQGQSKKLKVISEKKLMDWILALLKQHMAGKADTFSDAEKAEMLRKTQELLKERMHREQVAETERARLAGEYDKAMSVLNDAKASQADYAEAVEALKTKLANAENTVQDLQQDNYDLQDQLQEKMALLSTTIAEKEKLRETVRAQMVHSGDLIGGVLGIDNQYYGGRHQEENPVSEEAGQDEQFYHDFDTGAKVIATLNADLERLRGIASTAAAEKEAADADPRKNLLEGDLALLEQLKSGSLTAMDVSQPVATLIEALEGARNEAEAMEEAVARVTGNSSQQVPFTSLPDADGDPAEVLAGATTVARELAAELARSKQRVIALKQIADEAEGERGTMEAELQAVREGNERLLAALKQKADADRVPVSAAVSNPDAPAAERADAALEVVERLHAGSPVAAQAMSEQLAVANRLLGDESAAPAEGADAAEVADRLRKAGKALEKLVKEQRAEIEAASEREKELASQVAELARTHRSAPDAPRSPELERTSEKLEKALAGDDREAIHQAAAAASKVVAALSHQAEAEQTSNSARLRKLEGDLESAKSAEKELRDARAELEDAREQLRSQAQAARSMASQVMKAAKGDERLADAGADLALALEQGGQADDGAEALSKQLQETLGALSARKVELQRENERLAAEAEKARAELAKVTDGRDQAALRERQVADVVVAAAKGDEDLADAAADLALALDQGGPDEPLDVQTHVASAIRTLSERKRALTAESEQLKGELETLRAEAKETAERCTALESERDEMAESGKEIIGQLRQQKDAREKELVELRAENERAATKLEEFEGRMSKAESANRKLAEALAGIATIEAKSDMGGGPSIEDPRMDLEVALSQLPNEGEEDVVAPPDIAQQIADSGQKLAQALIARREAAAAALARAAQQQERLQAEIERLKAEAAQARSAVEERDNGIRRNQAEVNAIRKEMADQGNALASRVQELSSARSELAGAKADLETAQSRVAEQDGRLNEARAQLAEARKDLERLRSEHADAQARAESAEQNQLAIAQSLRSLGTMGGGGMSEPISKAAQKMEMARASGGDELASAGKAFVETVRTHAQQLSQELAGTRAQLEQAKADAARLNDELGQSRGALVDREHALETIRGEVIVASEAQATAEAALLERDAELSAVNDTLAALQEKLRQTEAELEDYRAREGASAGALGDELVQLRDESAKALAARKALEAQLAELREKLEASEARLKRQREELTRRLEERDKLVQEKDRQLDEFGSRRVDAKGLEAQVEALTQQLAQAAERVKELESLSGAAAGHSSKSGDLAKELKKAHLERDALREKQRQLEGDLAEAVSSQEELQTQLEEKRKETQAARGDMAQELVEERQKTASLKEEFRKLKEEVVGLRARLRRLTDDR